MAVTFLGNTTAIHKMFKRFAEFSFDDAFVMFPLVEEGVSVPRALHASIRPWASIGTALDTTPLRCAPSYLSGSSCEVLVWPWPVRGGSLGFTTIRGPQTSLEATRPEYQANTEQLTCAVRKNLVTSRPRRTHRISSSTVFRKCSSEESLRRRHSSIAQRASRQKRVFWFQSSIASNALD